ncbi:hypothetical protein IWW37_000706 [Coemansia sp. RSA 2050]|nr:hypothetical protein IWW37_000706 [Coemansia sp. RSA 2050]KAJ2735930.1 hypothetical protein IW152_001228 [Coemansia sp. BCRC 34962]
MSQAMSPMPSALPHVRVEQAQTLRALLSTTVGAPHLISRSPAGYAKRALHATVSRLLTCLVNEQIVDGYYVDYSSSDVSNYIFVVPHGSTPGTWAKCSIISQVFHKPVLAKSPLEGSANVYRVCLLDPEEVGADQWIQQREYSCIVPITKVTQIMRLVGEWISCDPAVIEPICNELSSSVENQISAYAHRKPEPNILTSTAIEWEQSLVEGHATHPMHRTRHSVPPLEPIAPETDLFDIALTFVAVPRSRLKIEGKFECLLAALYASAAADNGSSAHLLDSVDTELEVVMPVHPLHNPAVLKLFAFVRHLPFSVPAQAQASLRTLCPQALAPLGYDIKLPLGIKTTSALRTISPWSAFAGPRITEAIPAILRNAPIEDALLIAGEPASAVSADPDYDIAKYLTCVIRNDPEYICRPRGERVIMAAALTSNNDDGVSTVVRQWRLDTADKRRSFLRNYTEILFDAFLPPIMDHGFAFEAHPQNCLLRIGAEAGDLRGFIVRDFGGIKVHLPTFTGSTGVSIPMLPNSTTEAQSMHEVYDLAYHTLIQCQLHRLVRALHLHYHGNGWAVVRESFERRVPVSHPLRKAWYQNSSDLKCFITMKLDGLYRDYVYRRVPNVLFYGCESEGIVACGDIE